MDVRSTLVVHPVEARLDGKSGEHSVFAAIAIGRGDVDGSALVVQRIDGVEVVLVPAFRHPQLHARPLIHHRDGEDVELLFQALQR